MYACRGWCSVFIVHCSLFIDGGETKIEYSHYWRIFWIDWWIYHRINHKMYRSTGIKSTWNRAIGRSARYHSNPNRIASFRFALVLLFYVCHLFYPTRGIETIVVLVFLSTNRRMRSHRISLVTGLPFGKTSRQNVFLPYSSSKNATASSAVLSTKLGNAAPHVGNTEQVFSLHNSSPRDGLHSSMLRQDPRRRKPHFFY